MNAITSFHVTCGECGREEIAALPTLPVNWTEVVVSEDGGRTEARCPDCSLPISTVARIAGIDIWDTAFDHAANAAEYTAQRPVIFGIDVATAGSDQIAFGPPTLLHTRDGRRIGNGVIYGAEIGTDGLIFHIETDFGNRAKFTADEVLTLFHVADVTSMDRWRRDRDAVRAKNNGGGR